MRSRFFARLAAAIALLTGLCSCQREDAGLALKTGLVEGALAQIGPVTISQADMQLWPRAERPELNVLVSDTLLSLESRRVAPHRAQVVERGALSRAILEQLEQEELRGAPLTTEELEATKREHWLSLDRPRAVRSAVVRVPVDPLADDAPYLALAKELHAAAASAHNLESLLAALDSVPARYEVQKMRVPPVAEDGLVVPMIPQDYDMKRLEPGFAKQAAKLTHPGELSAVFATSDAYQFIFATEIVSELRADTPLRKQQLKKLAVARRIAKTVSTITDRKGRGIAYTRKELPALLKLVWRK